MSIFSFLWPQVLEKVYSPISGEIEVIEEFGKRRMEIGGLTQSGGIVEKIWKKALMKIRNSKFEIRNCLILGLGAGTAAKMVSNFKFPTSEIRIVGVEIDPEVIRLGKKYFGLGEIRNLKIVIKDAKEYLHRPFNRLTGELFDLILVDLYQGRKIPEDCQSEKFLGSLKRLKEPKGQVIFNRLYSWEERAKTERFKEKCQQIFDEVRVKRVICNLMVFCR